MRLHDPLHGRQAAPNSSHLTRGLVKSVPGRGYFRAVPSQNGDKYVTSPPLAIVELSIRYQNTDIVLTPISFRCSRFVVPGMNFVAIWIPVSLKSREHVDLLLLPYRCCITLHLNANLDRQGKPELNTITILGIEKENDLP